VHVKLPTGPRRGAAILWGWVRRDCYTWRLIGTALSFTLFGVGGVVLGLTLVPLVMLFPGTAAARQARVREVIRLGFRSFIGFMRGVGVLTYEIEGADRLGRPGQLIVANHPSLIDVVFLIAFTPKACCVVKRALWRNPAGAIAVRGAGYVPNTPTERMIGQASAALASGQSLIMFPEGTRSRSGRPRHFHRGAANIAVRSAAAVTPVFVKVAPTTLTKSSPWYRIPSRRPHFSLRVGDDLDPAPFRERQSIPLASRALNDRLLSVYAHELGGI